MAPPPLPLPSTPPPLPLTCPSSLYYESPSDSPQMLLHNYLDGTSPFDVSGLADALIDQVTQSRLTND